MHEVSGVWKHGRYARAPPVFQLAIYIDKYFEFLRFIVTLFVANIESSHCTECIMLNSNANALLCAYVSNALPFATPIFHLWLP
jgi:hypothetical protein